MEYDPGVEADSVEEPGEFFGISDVPEADFLCCYSTVEGLHCTDIVAAQLDLSNCHTLSMCTCAFKKYLFLNRVLLLEKSRKRLCIYP